MKTSAIPALVAVQVEALLMLLLMFAENATMAPSWPELEWAAVVVPVTRSPVTGTRDRPTTLQPDSLRFSKSLATAGRLDPRHHDSGMLASTTEKSSHRASASSVVIVTGAYRVGNKPDGEEMTRGKNRRRGKKSRPCKCRKGKNRDGGENRCAEDCRGKNRHGKGRRGNDRNGKKKPARTTNKNGAEIIVDNKVFVNLNGDRPTSSVPPRTETTVSRAVSVTPLDVGRDIYNYWKRDILLIVFEVVCVLTVFATVSLDCLTTFGCRRRA